MVGPELAGDAPKWRGEGQEIGLALGLGEATRHARFADIDQVLKLWVDTPEPGGVVIAGGQDRATVRAEPGGPDLVRMTLKHGDFITGFAVPEPGGVVSAGGDDALTVRAEPGAPDPVLMAFEHGDFITGFSVPEPGGVVPFSKS